MALNFPANPKRGDIITAGERKWKYTGTTWIRVDRANQGARGIPGATGSAGATGATGATGPVEEFVASINGITGDIITSGLTFAFEGITVGVSGISIDGAVSFLGETGDIKNPSSGSAKIDISVGSSDFTLGRFARTNGVVTVGDVDQASNGTRIEVTTKTQTVDVYAGQKLHLHDGVFFPANGISLGVGLTFPDGSFQSSAHAPHEFVASFNGATGAIEGVNSFNGLTGAIDTSSLTLHVAGLSADGTVTALGISGPSAITFSNGEVIRNSPDGSIQIVPSDEGGNHFGIEIDATEWGFGPVVNVIDESGTQVTKAIRLDTDVVMSNTNVPDGTPARLLFNNASDRGFQQNNNGDGTVMFGVNGNNGHFAVGRKADLSDGDRSMSTSDKTALGMTNPQFLVYSADSTDANDYLRIEHDQTDANIYSGTGNINLAPAGGAVGISGGGLDIKANGITFADGTFQRTATKDVATFTIDASSSIATGTKTNALYRIPYNATLTNFDVKTNATGGLTAAIVISGSDFGSPTTSSATGCSLGIEGITGSSTVFNTASVNAGDFIFLHITSNNSGASAAQAFLTFESR